MKTICDLCGQEIKEGEPARQTAIVDISDQGRVYGMRTGNDHLKCLLREKEEKRRAMENE